VNSIGQYSSRLLPLFANYFLPWERINPSINPPPPVILQPPVQRWCVLLTATSRVQVNLRSNTWGKAQQLDARARRATYARSLRSWLGAGYKMPIVLVENSDDAKFVSELRAQLLSANSSFFAGVPMGARRRAELLSIGPSPTCGPEEIGCHEASALLRGVNASSLFRREPGGRPPRCTHALKVTGRYFVHGLPAALERCPAGASLAVEDAKATAGMVPYRQETMVGRRDGPLLLTPAHLRHSSPYPCAPSL